MGFILCVSVCYQAYLIYMLKASYDIFRIFIVWISLKRLFKVLSTFTDHHCLLRFFNNELSMDKRDSFTFQED